MSNLKERNIKSRRLKYYFKIILYAIEVFLITLVVSNIILTVVFNEGVKLEIGIIVSSITMLLITYWKWFKPARAYKTLVKRAELYNNILEDKEKTIEILKKALEADNITEDQKMSTYKRIGHLYLESREYSSAENYFKKALSVPTDELLHGDTIYQIGMHYYEEGDYLKAVEYIDKALEYGFSSNKKMHIDFLALEMIVKAYIYSTQEEKAKEIYHMLVNKKMSKNNRKIEELFKSFGK